MKRNFDTRHRSEIPDVQTESTALGRKGLDLKSSFASPYFVTKIAKQQGILKIIYCEGPRGKVEEVSLSNVLPHHLWRDGNGSLG